MLASCPAVSVRPAKLARAPARASLKVRAVAAAPTTTKTVAETAAAAGTFNTLLSALKAANLVDAVSTGTVTVFAPTDDAFKKLPAGA